MKGRAIVDSVDSVDSVDAVDNVDVIGPELQKFVAEVLGRREKAFSPPFLRLSSWPSIESARASLAYSSGFRKTQSVPNPGMSKVVRMLGWRRQRCQRCQQRQHDECTSRFAGFRNDDPASRV